MSLVSLFLDNFAAVGGFEICRRAAVIVIVRACIQIINMKKFGVDIRSFFFESKAPRQPTNAAFLNRRTKGYLAIFFEVSISARN